MLRDGYSGELFFLDLVFGLATNIIFELTCGIVDLFLLFLIPLTSAAPRSSFGSIASILDEPKRLKI